MPFQHCSWTPWATAPSVEHVLRGSTTEDSDAAVAYLEGGAGDVPAENERQWQRLALWPRVLSGVEHSDLTTEVLGVATAAPVLVAASAAHGLWHPGAEVETARGVRGAGLLMSLSQGSTRPPEEVAAVTGPYLQQLYLPERRELVAPFVERVAGLGAAALVLTVDQLPVAAEQPFRARLRELWQAPAWSAYDATAAGGAPARSFTPEDVAWVAGLSDLPVLVKGVLHPDDARLAVEAGAAGVVVSNHGGRQLAGSVTPAEVLGEVVAAVGDRAVVHVDSGVRTAEDVFRALCLGAHAVHVGRPALRALAAGGAPAVTDWLSDLLGGLSAVMQLAGVRDVAACGPERLRLRA